MQSVVLGNSRFILYSQSRSRTPTLPRNIENGFTLSRQTTSIRFQSSPSKSNCMIQYPHSRRMSTSHEERTAAEPRDNAIHDVILSEIVNVNDDIRLLRLKSLAKSRIGSQTSNVDLSCSSHCFQASYGDVLVVAESKKLADDRQRSSIFARPMAGRAYPRSFSCWWLYCRCSLLLFLLFLLCSPSYS